MHRKHILISTLIAIAISGVVQPAVQAQQVVEGLLRGFLEAQMEKERRKALERQQAADRHRHVHRPAPAPSGRVSPELQDYRSTLSSFSNQANDLATVLQRSSRVRGVRPLMSDVLKVKATASLMQSHAREADDLALLREEYRDLDCQWRDISFRLGQLRGLDPAASTCIRQLDGYCDSICRHLDLQAQFDRDEVASSLVEAAAHLTTLEDVIQFDLYRHPEHAQRGGECRGLAEQCRRISRVARRGSYDELLTQHTAFVTDWQKFAAKLYAYKNPRCGRTIRRIRGCNRDVFYRLRRTNAIDRAYLTHVSHRMAEDVNSLFENMTVKTLVQMPATQQQAVLDTARELYRHCEHYCECVDKNATLNDLISDYVELERHWTTLDRYLHPVQSGSLVVIRRQITDYNNDLRDLMQVPARMNRDDAIHLAAALEELAEHMRYDVRRYGRYYRSSGFRDQAYRASDAFYVQVKQLHQNAQQQASLQTLRSNTHAVISSWNSFSVIISAMPSNGLTDARYQFIQQSRQDVSPVLAELATTFGT